jgi:TolA-binding protein
METNYTDSIVVPSLLKKTQELLNSSVILDINLQIEQAKVKDLTEKLSNVSLSETKKVIDVENRARDMEASLSSRIRDLEEQLQSANEKLVNHTATRSRVSELEEQLKSANGKIVDLKREKQNVEIQSSQIQKVFESKINTLEEEIRVLKTVSTSTTKKQKKTVELEGGVF